MQFSAWLLPLSGFSIAAWIIFFFGVGLTFMVVYFYLVGYYKRFQEESVDCAAFPGIPLFWLIFSFLAWIYCPFPFDFKDFFGGLRGWEPIDSSNWSHRFYCVYVKLVWMGVTTFGIWTWYQWRADDSIRLNAAEESDEGATYRKKSHERLQEEVRVDILDDISSTRWSSKPDLRIMDQESLVENAWSRQTIRVDYLYINCIFAGSTMFFWLIVASKHVCEKRGVLELLGCYGGWSIVIISAILTIHQAYLFITGKYTLDQSWTRRGEGMTIFIVIIFWIFWTIAAWGMGPDPFPDKVGALQYEPNYLPIVWWSIVMKVSWIAITPLVILTFYGLIHPELEAGSKSEEE